MEGKIAVLGDTDFVMPFSALGVDTFAVEQTPAEISESARKIVEENYALVVVAENIATRQLPVSWLCRLPPNPKAMPRRPWARC
jgi:vacuolar-type H+-ATPase subunit F/Vma7